ncbi:restriction endonuclease [Bradyrhizobium sp. SZCCHNR1093]|uniref:restriction endonuclease n=1 Tax=Bradyrhizobium sp. SZCCHNR1093 TaxID=3057368 RepID=UPI0028EFFE68|nr:restriction endonuclease [Bradyrhizobium sp. SZCCHNR1093]
MSTLDFSELSSKPSGEAFEGLIRLIGERLGVTVSWTGRGVDQGRDLIFYETQAGRIGSSPVRWLVNCKDNSKTNKAVTEQDVGSISDKVKQHDCNGFLLATTTTAGTALKSTLDALASDIARDRIQTRVWDRFELTKILLSDQFADLLRQFFPRQSASNSAMEIDAARKKIESALPRQVVGAIRQHLVPYSERYASLAGSNVWPHDAAQQTLIDQLRPLVVRGAATPRTAEKLSELNSEAFFAFTDQLIRSFPKQAYNQLLFYAKTSKDSARIFNLVGILQEFDEFSDELEYSITAHCDSDTLWDLYRDHVEQSLCVPSYWWNRIPTEIESFASNSEIVDIELDDLEFDGGESVTFCGRLQFNVTSTSEDDEGEHHLDRQAFTYSVSGRPAGSGAVVDELTFLY